MTVTDDNLGTEDIAQETAVLDRLHGRAEQRVSDDRPAVPSTFDEYVRVHNLPADHQNLEGWRKVWQRELQVEANAPKVIPTCPDWCALTAGHGYDGWGRVGRRPDLRAPALRL